MKNFSLIGAGRVGTTISRLLAGKGYQLKGVYTRTKEKAQVLAAELGGRVVSSPGEAARMGDLVLIATPDRVIGEVCQLASQEQAFRPGQVILHFSGSLGLGVLAPARDQGASPLAFHPLQSFTGNQEVNFLSGSYCGILAEDPLARDVAERLVNDLEVKPIYLQEKDKPLYHAAASVASNYLVSLVHLATWILAQTGLTPEKSLEALFPLIRGTLANVECLGTELALTGPIVRGDAGTVAGHLMALGAVDPFRKRVYQALGRYTLELARKRGTLGREEALTLEKLLDEENGHGKGNHPDY